MYRDRGDIQALNRICRPVVSTRQELDLLIQGEVAQDLVYVKTMSHGGLRLGKGAKRGWDENEGRIRKVQCTKFSLYLGGTSRCFEARDFCCGLKDSKSGARHLGQMGRHRWPGLRDLAAAKLL